VTKTEYAEYLASDHWITLRFELLCEVSACERCSMPRWLASIAYDQDLHVHHKHYRTLGSEEWDDLEVLCARCHEVETFGRSSMKAPKSSRCSICKEVHFDYRSEFCDACYRITHTPYLHWIRDVNSPADFLVDGPFTMRDHIIRSLNWNAEKSREESVNG
jgi:HNH endonuclease